MKKSSESGEKYAQIKNHLQVKTIQNISKQILYTGGFRCERTTGEGLFFFTGGSVIMENGHLFGPKATVKKGLS